MKKSGYVLRIVYLNREKKTIGYRKERIGVK